MPTVIDPDGETVTVIPNVDPDHNSRPFEEWGDRSTSVSLIDGRPVSYADLYASQTWVAAAIDWFLWKTALVPLKVYRRTGTDGAERKRLRRGQHPLADAIAKPWDGGTSVSLAQHLLGPLLVHGNSLTGVDEGARGKLRFSPADWRSVKPVRPRAGGDRSRILGWIEYLAGDDERALKLDETMHLAWWSPFGRPDAQLGVSPLRKLGTTLRLEEAAKRWATGTLARGFRPNGVVTLDERFLKLNDGEQQELYNATARRLRKAYGRGADTAGEVPIFPPGVEYAEAKPTTAVEAQLIDQRKVDREEIAAVYQVPPPMLGILDRATFSNINTLRQVAYTDALAPPLVTIEAIVNAVVCNGMLREPDVFVEFDFGGVLRGDRLNEIKAIREAIATGVLTPNEGRALTNRPQSTNPGANELYLPTNNLKPLGSESDDGGSRRRRRR